MAPLGQLPWPLSHSVTHFLPLARLGIVSSHLLTTLSLCWINCGGNFHKDPAGTTYSRVKVLLCWLRALLCWVEGVGSRYQLRGSWGQWRVGAVVKLGWDQYRERGHTSTLQLRSDAGSSFQFQLVSADSIRVDCSAIKGFPRHPGSQLDLQTNTFRGITII